VTKLIAALLSFTNAPKQEGCHNKREISFNRPGYGYFPYRITAKSPKSSYIEINTLKFTHVIKKKKLEKGSNRIQKSTTLLTRHINSHCHTAHGRDYGQSHSSLGCALLGTREVRQNRSLHFNGVFVRYPLVKIYLFISTCKCVKKNKRNCANNL
jgi:hypothetical protein